MSITCTSCGLPMLMDEYHARGDRKIDWCRFCADPAGKLYSYNQTLERLTEIMAKTHGLDVIEARPLIAAQLAKLPAWRNRGE
jgi:Putative zinc ribbon domain